MFNKKTAVLLIGFGGPESPNEVRPFLQSVLQGVQIPQARFDEVLRHYEAVGGVSPYNAATFKQKEALERWFKNQNIDLPVFVGFRHSIPSFKDVFLSLKENKIQQVIGFVLSPLRSYASFEKYLERAEEGKKEAQASFITLSYTDIFHRDPLFIKAQTERVQEVLDQFPDHDRSKVYLLFSAHSIPAEMSKKSGYAEQFIETVALVSKTLGIKNGGFAYQSRSGNPKEPWLSPDVSETISSIDRKNFETLIVVPVGFLNENVEILYDLDIEAKQAAQSRDLRYFRASTVTDHPDFIETIGRSVLKKMGELS